MNPFKLDKRSISRKDKAYSDRLKDKLDNINRDISQLDQEANNYSSEGELHKLGARVVVLETEKKHIEGLLEDIRKQEIKSNFEKLSEKLISEITSFRNWFKI
jgi:hypothetical protein